VGGRFATLGQRFGEIRRQIFSPTGEAIPRIERERVILRARAVPEVQYSISKIIRRFKQD